MDRIEKEFKDSKDSINKKESLGTTKKRDPDCSESLLGGDYLLSHFRSTIGVVRLNFSVRNGKRWDPHAITTLMTSAMNNEQCIMNGPLSMP